MAMPKTRHSPGPNIETRSEASHVSRLQSDNPYDDLHEHPTEWPDEVSVEPTVPHPGTDPVEVTTEPRPQHPQRRKARSKKRRTSSRAR